MNARHLPRAPLFLLLALAFGLFAYGISWGLPSWRGWAGDELIPPFVARASERGFSGGWHTKYPPFHYLLLAAVQAPVRWAHEGGLAGGSRFELHNRLFLAGRWLSVALALGTVVLAAQAGRRLSDARAGLFAGLAAALMPPLVYFAKTANVDGPSLFWMAASLVFFLRILDRHRLSDYVLFPVTAMLAVATKDPSYGLYVLSPLPILLSLHRHRAACGEPAGWWRTLLDRRAMAAAAAGLATLLLAFGIPWNLKGFLGHVETLTGPQSEEPREYPNTPLGHLHNLGQTLWHVRFCLGWPFFVAALLGIFWIFRRGDARERFGAGALLLLALSYDLTFLSVVLFSRARYVLPIALIFALFAGRFLADFTAPGRLRGLRVAAVGAAVAWSLLGALGVDLRMAHDSRYAVEEWLHPRTPLRGQALGVGREKHLPRIATVEWRRVWRNRERVLEDPRARYLVVNVTDLRTPRERELYEELLAGAHGWRLSHHEQWESPWDFLDLSGSLTTLSLVNPKLAVFERGGAPSQPGGDQDGGLRRQEQPLERPLDGEGDLVRVRGVADRAADHDVVRSVADRLFDGDHPLLVVGRPVLHRADAGGHDQQALAQVLLQGPGLQPRGDHAVAAELQRPPSPGEHQVVDVHLEAQVVEVAPVEAGQHGDGEDLQVPLLAAGGFEDAVVAVDRGEGDRAPAELAHGGGHGLRDVEQFQVQEDLLLALEQPVHHLESLAREEELEPHLVEEDRLAQRLDEPLRLGGGGHVEREDQPLLGGDGLGGHVDGIAGSRLLGDLAHGAYDIPQCSNGSSACARPARPWGGRPSAA
jgi:hypothetical protein